MAKTKTRREHLTSSMSIKDVELITKIVPQRKLQVHVVLTANSPKRLRKKYYHHQGLERIGDWLVIPTPSLLNFSIWPVQKPNGS